MKGYTTGQVAKICGFKSHRKVASLIDREELRGEMVDSKLGRKRTRVVWLCDLIEFMKRHKIGFDGFDGDVHAQKFILNQRIAELKRIISQAGERGGVFFGFKGLPNALLDVIRVMDPLDNLSGASEDRKRAAIFRRIADTMACHIRVRGRVVRSKSNHKAW